jgi:hypothetical protein
MSKQIVLQADESATVVVMHSDASMSTVQVKADETAMMLVVIDANPAIPYGLITRESDDEAELHAAAVAAVQAWNTYYGDGPSILHHQQLRYSVERLERLISGPPMDGCNGWIEPCLESDE